MVATGTRRGGLVYHWRHGWIPLDHYAALSKAKGSHKGAAKIMEKHGIGPHKGNSQLIARGDLRRSPHISAAHAPGGNVSLHDSRTGHSVKINSGHAASLHSQGHTITAVHEHGLTTRSDSGVLTKRGTDTRAVEAPKIIDARNMTAQQKIDNAARMWGAGSKRHKQAIARFTPGAGAKPSTSKKYRLERTLPDGTVKTNPYPMTPKEASQYAAMALKDNLNVSKGDAQKAVGKKLESIPVGQHVQAHGYKFRLVPV